MKLAKRHELPDPKTFIKPIGLPFPSHKGVKIQARSFNVYNATQPSRDEIRKENYSRRLDQMSSMGFKTPMNVPYRIIGNPLYLDHKRIILYGLGQFSKLEKENDNKVEFIKPPSHTNSDQETANKTQQTKNTFNIKNLKRAKELYKLQDEVNKTRNLIRRVKLGQSFFDIIRQEDEIKQKKIEAEKNSLSASMQIRPMIESDEEIVDSEDEYYYELNRLNDNNSPTGNSIFNQHSLNTPFPSSDYQQVEKVAKSWRILANQEKEKIEMSEYTTEVNAKLNRPQTYPVHQNNISLPSALTRRPKTLKAKKAKEHPKPFTPVYSSLLSKDETISSDKSSISRQMCVLLWIMESISIEPPVYVGPLRTCFMIKDLGGEKSKENYAGNLKKVDGKWRKFKALKIETDKNYNKNKSRKGKSAPYDTNTDLISELLNDVGNENELEFSFSKENHHSKQVSETPPSLIYEWTQEDELNLSRMPTRIKNNALGESHISLNNFNESIKSVSENAQNQDAVTYNNNRIDFSRQVSIIEHPFYQNGDNQNTGTNTSNKGNKHKSTTSASNQQQQSTLSNSSPSKIPPSKIREKIKQDSPSIIPEHDLEMLKIGDVEEMDRIFNKHTIKRDRKNSKSLKATTGAVHALWTEKVVDFQNNLPSVKKSYKIKELKEKFDGIFDESTIEIHKRLEELLKKRTKTCLIKLLNMDLNQRGIHKMLEKMNESVIEHQKSTDLKNSPEPKYYQWYSDLETLIVTFYSRDDCILGKLLDKLAIYGKLNSKKQNEALFFKVLDTLRIWELCSPDVMSAVEFCRERILEIQVEDFESWFQSKHPDYFISRNPNNKNQIQIENSGLSSTNKVNK